MAKKLHKVRKALGSYQVEGAETWKAWLPFTTCRLRRGRAFACSVAQADGELAPQTLKPWPSSSPVEARNGVMSPRSMRAPPRCYHLRCHCTPEISSSRLAAAVIVAQKRGTAGSLLDGASRTRTGDLLGAITQNRCVLADWILYLAAFSAFAEASPRVSANTSEVLPRPTILNTKTTLPPSVASESSQITRGL